MSEQSGPITREQVERAIEGVRNIDYRELPPREAEEAAQVAEHFVCPGCHAVDEEACLPGCIDAEIEGERRTPFDGFSEFMADDEGDEPEEGGAS